MHGCRRAWERKIGHLVRAERVIGTIKLSQGIQKRAVTWQNKFLFPIASNIGSTRASVDFGELGHLSFRVLRRIEKPRAVRGQAKQHIILASFDSCESLPVILALIVLIGSIRIISSHLLLMNL